MIRNYEDFKKALFAAGFSMSGGNSDGIYAVIPWGWNEVPPYDTPVCWHTGDPDTDPWEWCVRVLDEGGSIAYAKLFFKKGGFLTKDWYSHFLAVRRGGMTFEDAYAEGEISHFAKRIYELVISNGRLPRHTIRTLGGFSKADNSAFDRALIELQMKMYLTICGRQQKLSQMGVEYGWSSMVFCAVESYFGADVFEKAGGMCADDAYGRIREQILKLNPLAEEKQMSKFILGMR